MDFRSDQNTTELRGEESVAGTEDIASAWDRLVKGAEAFARGDVDSACVTETSVFSLDADSHSALTPVTRIGDDNSYFDFDLGEFP